jgi:tellurite resistance protein TerC
LRGQYCPDVVAKRAEREGADMSVFPAWAWGGFTALVVVLLVLDLFVLARGVREISFRRAALLSGFWIGVALLFGVVVFAVAGPERGGEYFAGYIIEKSLSVDNVFVFALIFSYFALPARYQYRVLFWGVVGALILRAVFVLVGAEQLKSYDWMIYVFGAFLILTGIRMAFQKDKKLDPEKNPALRWFRRIVPVTPDYVGGRFFTRIDGRLWATPLLVALLFVEISDIVFAVDSIPAILAVSQDAFIVYTANVFAILGLRSLYFALAGIMGMFHHLHYGLSLILGFVGTKMLLVDTAYKIPTGIALGVVAAILAIAIAVSLLFPRREQKEIEPVSAAGAAG